MGSGSERITCPLASSHGSCAQALSRGFCVVAPTRVLSWGFAYDPHQHPNVKLSLKIGV
jgi:hypothetical protein